MSAGDRGVLLIGHGTVDSLDDLPAFLTGIRRGRPAPPDLVAEVRRRYEAIGGKSPLASICADLARRVEARLGVPVEVAGRMWRPSPREALEALLGRGASRIAVVPLAQHSAAVYGEAAEAAAREIASGSALPPLTLACAENWGAEPALTRAFAAEIRHALGELPDVSRARTRLFLTAHSLPLAVIRGGDPYEREVRASAAAVLREVGAGAPPAGIAFQSQGMGGGEWLGPDLPTSLDAARASGATHVVVAPIGFLADHVEVLYDLDIEAKALAADRGLALSRTRSLNDSEGLVEAISRVASPLLARTAGSAGGT